MLTADQAISLAGLHSAIFDGTGERSWTAQDFLAAATNSVQHIWTWTQPGSEAPIGLAVLQIVAGSADLLTFGVQPDQRGRGIAAMMFGGLCDTLKTHSVATLFIEVRVSNIAAVHVYQQHGAFEIDRRANYYKLLSGQREDALCLRIEF